MPETNSPSSNSVPDNPAPPIPEKARPVLAWVVWFLVLVGPTAGLLIPILTEGTTLKVLTAILGLLVSGAGAIKLGLVNPLKSRGAP